MTNRELTAGNPICDVVVRGSAPGPGGHRPCVNCGSARGRLFEKDHAVGKASARCGGSVWIPNNPHMAKRHLEGE
jgi:hypothetical protein